MALLYLILPEFRGGYLIAERVAPLAAMLAVVALPPPAVARRRLVAALVAAVLVFQLGQTLSAFLRFRAESAGLAAVLAGTAPGENLAGLIFDRTSASWPGMPVYLHTPAYYQVEKGGRILFSFAELFQTSARFRPGKSWDDLLREWNDWNPQFFDYGRHGGRFRYFLVRGGPRDVLAAFGGDPKRLGLKGRMAGEWWLFERPAADSPPEALDKPPHLWHNAAPFPRASSRDVHVGLPIEAVTRRSAKEGLGLYTGLGEDVGSRGLTVGDGSGFGRGRFHGCLKPTWLRGRALPW